MSVRIYFKLRYSLYVGWSFRATCYVRLSNLWLATCLCLHSLCCNGGIMFCRVRRGFCSSRLLSVPILCPRGFSRMPSGFLSQFHLQEYWTDLDAIRRSYREEITLHDYVLGKTGRGKTEEYSNRRRYCSDVKQVLTPSEWIRTLHYGRCDRGKISR